jgi:site-specific DNA-methyltransferase (adenine-specific)|tara:strand:- start:428 stop:871 length:444 start_codon:yes stop_codon:yes gene_type:complete
MPRGKTLEQREKERPEDGYWIIPPEIYNPLNKEFKFKFDPCPNPKPKEFNGLLCDWKKSNWVNPPFWAGITYWVRKAIEEQEKGKTSVLILPLDNWVKLLFDAGAEVRVVGSHDWIHTKDKTRRKAPRPSFLFVLKPKLKGVPKGSQ